jgi:hypothetical protein
VLVKESEFTKFVLRGEGVSPKLGQTHKLTGAQSRVWDQLTAGIHPTQAYLARIGAATSDIFVSFVWLNKRPQVTSPTAAVHSTTPGRKPTTKCGK